MDEFLSLSGREQCVYRFGRRIAHMHRIEDLYNSTRRNRVERIMANEGVDENNIDQVVDTLMQRFI